MADTPTVEIGPAASLLAACATAIANITGLTTSVGLSPFVSDAVGVIVFLLAGIYWTLRAWNSSQPQRTIGFNENSTRHRTWTASVMLQLLGAIALVCLAAWFAFPIVQRFAQPEWKVCGTIVSSCSAKQCISGLDDRRRQILSRCIGPRDASRYYVLQPQSLLDYKPSYLRLECEEKQIATVPTPSSFKTNKCDSLLELP